MTKRTEYDVCVIGTGAGGGVMIDELTAAGFDVVALERGPYLEPADFNDDELSSLFRRTLFAPHQLETYRRDSSSESETGRFNHLAHCVGGSTAHWSAASWRLRPDEMKVRSTVGPIEGASVADWPIEHAELEPYYAKADQAYGVAGTAGANPFEAARSSAYPNPAHPHRAASLAVEKGAKKLGLHPFPLPQSINSRVYGGRAACLNHGMCAGYGCPVHARGSSLAVHLPRAEGTGRLDLRAEARVREITVADGKARSVIYLDGTGAEHEVRAKQVVLAAGAIGSPQLLLMSSGSSPDGLANGSGQVGRNLTFHVTAMVAFWTEGPSLGAIGQPGQVAIDDHHPHDAKRGFARGGVIYEIAEANPIYYAVNSMSCPSAGKGWGPELKRYLRDYRRAAQLLAIAEDLPREQNRVDLDPDVKDHLGLPVPRLTHENHPNDIALQRYFEQRMIEIAETSGAEKAWPVKLPGLTDLSDKGSQKGSHHLHGTCRMGDDPATSVVDRWCKSHEVPNLWVVDGSVFPTAGGYNPTLTIVANAYRVAEHFVAEAKKGGLA